MHHAEFLSNASMARIKLHMVPVAGRGEAILVEGRPTMDIWIVTRS